MLQYLCLLADKSDELSAASAAIRHASDQGPLGYVMVIAMILIATYQGLKLYYVDIPESKARRKTEQATQELTAYLRKGLEDQGGLVARIHDTLIAMLAADSDSPLANHKTNKYLKQLLRISRHCSDFIAAGDRSPAAYQTLALRIRDALDE